jgi:hypothetical protein
MKFGDKEWFRKLEEMTKFPSMIAFYVGTDGTINSKVINTKAERIGNIRYDFIKPTMLNDDVSLALVSIKRCLTSEDYYFECKLLKTIWTNGGNE